MVSKTKKRNNKSETNKSEVYKLTSALGQILLSFSLLFILFPLIYLVVLIVMGWLGNEVVGFGALTLQPLLLVGIIVAIANVLYFGFNNSKQMKESSVSSQKIIVFFSVLFAISFIIILIIPSGLRNTIYLLYSYEEVGQSQFIETKKNKTIEVSVGEARNLISTCSITFITFLDGSGSTNDVDISSVDSGLATVLSSNGVDKSLYVSLDMHEPIKTIFKDSEASCPYINSYDYSI